MPYNLLGGVAVFGSSVKMTPDIAERAAQQNAYFGLDGVEHIDGGGRGRLTKVMGILKGDTLADLILAKTLLESYHDGEPRAFYDSAGVLWSNVLMMAPRFVGGYRWGGRSFFWHYEVVMQHLTQT